jgi:murein DD-endopeptidase MepM/ murein hydrolase activator NlpD
MFVFRVLFALVAAISPAQPRPQPATAGLPQAASLVLVPPVAAVIVDRFRPPSCAWCAGNRGLEYDLVPGSEVHAAAPGIVTFAGPVAGLVYVVVDHGYGFRTTYGRLAAPSVAAGDSLSTGDVLGHGGPSGLYFGLRLFDQYLDPERYFVGVRPTRARLAP